MSFNNDMIGKGVIYPFKIQESGGVGIGGGLPLIETSLAAILNWEYGKRFFLAIFGSKAFFQLDEPNIAVTKALVGRFTLQAINLWEKRIQLLDYKVEQTKPDTLSITLYYKLRYSESSKVFDFTSDLTF